MLMHRTPYLRMLKIHQALERGTYPNCNKLARELEVNRRTIQRDIEFMQNQFNLPIAYDPRQQGYYYESPVESFPMMAISEKDIFGLLVVKKITEQYRSSPFWPLLENSMNMISKSLGTSPYFGFKESAESFSFKVVAPTQPELTLFNDILQAIQSSRQITFDYQAAYKRESAHTPRKLNPYHLYCIENHWYLVGLDVQQNDLRTYSLLRMKNLRVTGRSFTRPENWSPEKRLQSAFGVMEGDQMHTVEVEFSGLAALLVREHSWHPTQKIKDLDHDRLLFTVKVSHFEEIQRWILSFGQEAKVIKPKQLISRIQAELQASLRNYNDS